MNIITEYDDDPECIGFRWMARDFDSPERRLGVGETEQEAIADLLEQNGWGDQGLDTYAEHSFREFGLPA